MKIDYLSGHNLLVEIDGKALSLSYKGMGGKDKVLSLGEEGFNVAIEKLKAALEGVYNPHDIQSFFQVLSCGNAIVLIEAICPDEFAVYWLALAKSLNCYGIGCSFAKTLGFVSGTKDRLNHHQDNPFVRRLTELCSEVLSLNCSDDRSKALLKQFDDFQDVSSDGVRVSFLRAESNTYIYDVNGAEVIYCKRIRGDVSTSDVLAACIEIKNAIIYRSDLKPFTEQWGGSFVFRTMAAICADEAYLYFQDFAARATENRATIVGLKVLKDLNYDMKDIHNQEFIHRVLGALEQERNEQALELVGGNMAEIEKSGAWRLYYADGKEARYCTIDFTTIINPMLRQETLTFMRSLFKVGGRNYTNSIVQISRYAYSIIPCMSFLDTLGIDSLWELRNTHINALIGKWRNEERSVNYIAEALIFLRKAHRFITYEDFGRTDAVFCEAPIPKRDYAIRHVTPASDKAMSAVQDGYGELRACVELADLVLKALEARANDVFALPVDCVSQTEEGACYVTYTASKNGRPCKKLIPAWLAEKIISYADDTAELRAELDVNLLFVYQGERREGSQRQPQVLNADKFNYHIKKLLEKNGVEDIQGKSATQTARQIRSAAGKKRFASGQTPLQVAQALGNSEATAFHNYRQLDYREFAALRRDYYKRDMKHLTRPRKPLTQPESAPNYVDYGRCTKETPCNCVNICSRCPSRMIKRGDHI